MCTHTQHLSRGGVPSFGTNGGLLLVQMEGTMLHECMVPDNGKASDPLGTIHSSAKMFSECVVPDNGKASDAIGVMHRLIGHDTIVGHHHS